MRIGRWLPLLVLLAASAVACDRTTAAEHLANAQERSETGQLNAALIEVKNALRKDPSSAEARFLFARLLFRTGQYEDAVAEFERARAQGLSEGELRVPYALARISTGDPARIETVIGELEALGDEARSPEESAALGVALAAGGRLDEARAVLLEVIEKDAAIAEAQLAMARIERAQGRVGLARDYARGATEAAPEDDQAWLLLGELELAAEDPSRALEAFRKADEHTFGGNAAPRFGIVRAQLALGNLEEAEEILSGVLQTAPDQPIANFLLARLKLVQEDEEAALSALDSVLAALPTHLPSRYLRGALRLRRGDLARALEDLERVVVAEPSNLQARLLAAGIHSREGRAQRALDVLLPGLEYVEGSPLAAQYYAALGQTQLRSDRSTEGLANLERAIAIDPDAADIRTQLAVARLVSGESALAEVELEKVIDLSSSFPGSNELLILIQLREGRVDEALASARRFVEASPERSIAHNLLGAALFASQDLSAAERSFRQALEVDPQFEPAYLNLSRLAEVGGDRDEALAWVQRLLEQNPTSPAAFQRWQEVVAEEDPSALIAELREAVAADDSGSANRLLLARLLRGEGDVQGAFDTLFADEVDPGSSTRILRARGEVAMLAGKPELAVEAFRALRAALPEDQAARAQLAGALAASGDLPNALRVVEAGLAEAEAPSAGLLGLLVTLSLQAGDIEGAERAFQRLEPVAVPEAAGAVAELEGDLRIAQQRLGESEGAYRTALGEAVTRERIQKLYRVLRLQDRADDAAAVLEEWLDARPDDLGSWLLLGETRIAMGQVPEAIEAYERVRAAAPDNPVMLNNLAWLYGETGNPDAIEVARRALAVAPDAPAIQDTLAWLLIQAGEAEEGVSLLEKAVSRAPDDGEIRYHLAVGLEALGRDEDAAAELETALQGSPFASTDDARSRLDRLRRRGS
ncbi:MAG: XrtA/PEP-CTERM system TPR-repeat protein PrsT [Pseudomonadales bacterium]|nr:XrtA/PEP-CTERM system TPR-repeat protein PrsT [Pseudomonadales bacterium]